MSNDTLPLVLVVDDTPKNLQLVAEILSRAGFEPALAQDGPTALVSAARDKPDLILLDVLMPGMDGFEVCRRLKADPVTQGIPVIFLTAKTESGDILAGFERGGVDYVSKPFRVQELLARVKVHVELRKAQQEIRILRGFLPICSHCKKIRDEKGRWHPIEGYIAEHSEAQFSHSLCPDCVRTYFPDFHQEMGDG